VDTTWFTRLSLSALELDDTSSRDGIALDFSLGIKTLLLLG